MTLIVLSLVLLLSFYLIAKVCDEYFIESLDQIAQRFKMSNDIAGATLMAIGSSAPELFIAIIALVKPGNHEAIGMGTIVGSAIFNILVIIGASAVVKNTVLKWQPVLRDTIFYTISILLLLLVFRDGTIDIIEASIFVVIYVIYLIALSQWGKLVKDEKDDKTILEKVEEVFESKKNKIIEKIFPSKKRYYLTFIISIVIIAGLSWVLVESAIEISAILGIPEAIVALTVLAIGTSVPDMVSSVIVAKQGRGGMAISNAIGSNIFDILIGLGLPWLIFLGINGGTIPVSTENLYGSVVLLFATVLVIFFLFILRKWKIGNKSGYFLIILYVFYLIWSIYKISLT